MKKTASFLLVLFILAFLSLELPSCSSSHRDVFTNEGLVESNAEDLESTFIIVHLE